jgi:hypothetical protein
MHISKLLAGIGFLIDQTISLDVLFKEIRSDSSITDREVSFKIDVITGVYKMLLPVVDDLTSVMGQKPLSAPFDHEQSVIHDTLIRLRSDLILSLNTVEGSLTFGDTTCTTVKYLSDQNWCVQSELILVLRMTYRIFDEAYLRVSRWRGRAGSTEPQSLSDFIFDGKNPKVGPLRPFRPEDYWEIYKASLEPDTSPQKIDTSDTES